ncbi:MAG: universal stress protein [Pirellulaceae bacterium]
MNRFDDILLYDDPETEIDPALAYAARIARDNQGAITVVGCVDPVPGLVRKLAPKSWNLDKVFVNERQRQLDEIAKRLSNEGAKSKALALVGTPVVAITRQVMRGEHNLVMKTAQGEGEKKERGFFGTTALHLMRICPAPVCVVDPDESRRLKHILAVVDALADDREHADLNDKILDVAVSLSEQENAALSVLYAWGAYGEKVLARYSTSDEFESYMRQSRDEAQNSLDACLARFRARIEPARVHLVHGDAVNAIARFSEEEDVDLLMMGTVARRGIRGLLMGNTAERVMQKVRCSVMAVKPDGFESPVELDQA